MTKTAITSNLADVVNPVWTRQLNTSLAAATTQGDGTTNYYFDMTGYRYFVLQIEDTPGASGTNTYKIYNSLQDDGTAAASCTYQAVTSGWFGSASFTTDATLERDTPITTKYVKVEVVRTGDGAATDGAWTIHLSQSW